MGRRPVSSSIRRPAGPLGHAAPVPPGNRDRHRRYAARARFATDPVAGFVREVAEGARAFSLPLGFIVVIVAFLVVQSRLDRRYRVSPAPLDQLSTTMGFE